MNSEYFRRVARQTPTRLWVNNPTVAEAEAAIAAGAVSATTNPTYIAKMLSADSADRAVALKLLRDCVRTCPDDNAATDRLQLELCHRILEVFGPLHRQKPGRQGFVSIQGNPHHDDQADHIIAETMRYRAAAPNFIAKIPVNMAGLTAIEQALLEGIPVIATEVMSVAQGLAVCEMQKRVASKQACPPLYLTHITGIFDEHLANLVKAEDIAVDAQSLDQAGCIVARKLFAACRKTGAAFTFLGGGARHLRHFTEMVGGDMHVTINWSTAEEIMRLDPPVANRFDTPSDANMIRRLRERLNIFRQAYDDDGLSPDGFGDFGPVQYFRSMFIKGWDAAAGMARKERSAARTKS